VIPGFNFSFYEVQHAMFQKANLNMTLMADLFAEYTRPLSFTSSPSLVPAIEATAKG
jgi:hypothetical protein